MDANAYHLVNLQTLGEKYNLQRCFDARDRHFDCLDSFTDKLGK